MAALPSQEQEQTSPIRETAILFDWDSHRVFPGVQVTTDSPALNLGNAQSSARSTSPSFGSVNPTPDPLANFRGSLAGATIYNPSLPPVHWYLEPAGQSYLPLSNRRATELVADAFQPQYGSRLTLVFPAALPSDTREVTLGLPGAHVAFVLSIRSALATTPSSAYEVLDILMYVPMDKRLLAVRIKIPTIAALAVKGVNMVVEARFGSKEVRQVERVASMALMHDNRLFLALPGYHFPYILTVYNEWDGTSPVPSSWKSKIDYLVESIDYGPITESLRYLGNWFRAAPTHMEIFHLGKQSFVAALSPDGALRVLNAHSLKIALDEPLVPTSFASSKSRKEKQHAVSFHVHSAPGSDLALVAIRTNLGAWYSAKVTLSSSDRSTPTVGDFSALPSIEPALGNLESASATFVSATWLSDTVLAAQYKNVDRSNGSVMLGINLATQPSAAWARMPTATTQRTANGSSAVFRALRAFCAEYHVHATTMSAAADPALYMTEVAKAYTMMYPHMALEATVKGIEEYVSRALALDTETVAVVRVVAPALVANVPTDQDDEDMDQDAPQQDDAAAPDIPVDPVAMQAQLNAGMLLVIKRAGFSLIRQSTAADAMVDALGMAIQRPDRFVDAVAGVTPTFADAWAVADAATLAAVAQMGASAASLDAAVRRGADALVAQSFSEAILEWVSKLSDEVLNEVQNLQMRIVADAGIKEVAHTISAALDALAADAAPPTSSTPATGGIAVPHIVVPLLHDLLVDQQNLARAIVQVSLFVKTLAADRKQLVSPKLVLDRVLDLFRMPDLLVSEAMPLLTLTQHAPTGARVDQWAAGQLASAMARAREWTPVERTKFVMFAPAPAVEALLDAHDPECPPGRFLHALQQVVAEWQRGAADQAVSGVQAVVDALLEALQKEAKALEPLIRTEWLLLGETAASCMLDRGMHPVAAKLFDGVADLLVNECLRADLQKKDEAMYKNVQAKAAQLLGQAFSAYLQAGDVHQAIVVLTFMNQMPEHIVPKTKVKNRVAHLVDRMDPAHITIHPMLGLKAFVIDTVKAKLGMLLQKAKDEGPIGLTPRGLPVVVGMYEERANVYEMLWRLHIADEEMNALEAAKYAYYQARALWGAACAVASRVGVVVEDASGHGVEDWSRMDEVHEWAQLALQALGEAQGQLTAVPHKSFRMVLVHQNELAPHIGKTFVIQQSLMTRMFDEISLACILHQVHGESWYLRDMAATGLPTDVDREDGGHLLRHDPSRLKDLIVAIKECGDSSKAKDMMLRYADDVRSATGYDSEWLYEPVRPGLNTMA
ncbi:hypothetical protein BCR44DRAFT_80613 [Catenaria anguillulae PL171]|uniref:Uncharacterized protein n=1 Tax=Catenaria anguillulae PL171 TaxID=765915 RepID=A0A1Y2HN71_9FUNG|nr:hypothetical protein BCR44DRAFT_80613 [Catenaria anguillulae PL171]